MTELNRSAFGESREDVVVEERRWHVSPRYKQFAFQECLISIIVPPTLDVSLAVWCGREKTTRPSDIVKSVYLIIRHVSRDLGSICLAVCVYKRYAYIFKQMREERMNKLRRVLTR